MNYHQYHRYLRSPGWRIRRQFELERAGDCCEFCGDDQSPLNVHHLSYAHIGRELPEDLVVLCFWCHQDAHEFPGTIGYDITRIAASRRLTPGSYDALIEWLEHDYIPRIA